MAQFPAPAPHPAETGLPHHRPAGWPADRLGVARATTGLLLVGHGSTRSDAPRRQMDRLAADLAGRGLYAEVATAYVRGGEPVGESLARMTSPEIVVVPVLMAAGHVLQSGVREPVRAALAAARQAAAPVPAVHIGLPVGLHPGIAEIAAARAIQSFRHRGVSPRDGTLLLIAHGTPRHPASQQATDLQARRLAGLDVFGAIATAYLEQTPLLDDVLETIAAPAVAVGLFAAAGMHAGDETAAMIAARADRDIAYLGPVGEDARIAEVIIEVAASYRRGPRPLTLGRAAAGAARA